MAITYLPWLLWDPDVASLCSFYSVGFFSLTGKTFPLPSLMPHSPQWPEFGHMPMPIRGPCLGTEGDCRIARLDGHLPIPMAWRKCTMIDSSIGVTWKDHRRARLSLSWRSRDKSAKITQPMLV